MRYRTNASTLDELDLAILELSQLATFAAKYNGDRTINLQEAESHELILARAAYVDGTLGVDGEIDFPTKWHDIRQAIPPGLNDHSTHNLFPFEGKMTPKLARALINICVGARRDAMVCDPFCGSGTVLLEASIMGLDVYGCDIDPFAQWLTQTKLLRNEDEFATRLGALSLHNMTNKERAISLIQARSIVPPVGASVVRECEAQDFLDGRNPKHGLCDIRVIEMPTAYDAIVTSPPYFSAIDYVTRHHEYCEKLGLSKPWGQGLGVTQSVEDYHHDIDVIAEQMSKTLAPRGMAALVLGDHEGVPSSEWWELALKSAGLRRYARLRRPYQNKTRGFAEDIILVMEKV